MDEAETPEAEATDTLTLVECETHILMNGVRLVSLPIPAERVALGEGRIASYRLDSDLWGRGHLGGGWVVHRRHRKRHPR